MTRRLGLLETVASGVGWAGGQCLRGRPEGRSCLPSAGGLGEPSHGWSQARRAPHCGYNRSSGEQVPQENPMKNLSFLNCVSSNEGKNVLIGFPQQDGLGSDTLGVRLCGCHLPSAAAWPSPMCELGRSTQPASNRPTPSPAAAGPTRGLDVGSGRLSVALALAVGCRSGLRPWRHGCDSF